MKIRICILVTIIVFCCESQALSQQIEPDEKKHSKVYIGLNFGPGSSGIMNNPVSSLAALEIDRQGSLGGHIEVVYSFSKNLGLHSGIGFLKVGSSLSLNAYNESFNSKDSENDEFEYRIIASNISENQKMTALSIPVCGIFRLPAGKAGFFLQPGLGILIPIRNSYESTGKFTYKGYYPAYDILLENLPAYGFPTDKQIGNDGELDLNRAVINFMLTAGIDFSVSSKITIALGGNFYKTITELSDYPDSGNFRLSPEVDKINSLMSGTEKVSLESLGLSFSLRYRIN